MKRTPWYPANIKPVRVGVYEIKFGGFVFYGYYWNGEKWMVGKYSAFALWNQTQLKWRGLTAPVEASNGS